MHRRKFLKLTGVSLGAAGGALATLAEADTPSGDSDSPTSILEQASKRADELGKPLVLIPIPPDGPDVLNVQRVWGELFSTPNNEHLSLMALFEFSFAELPEGVEFHREKHCAVFRYASDRPWQPIPFAEGDPRMPETVFLSLQRAFVASPEQQKALVGLIQLSLGRFARILPTARDFPHTTPRLKIADADRGAAVLYERIQNSEDEDFKRWGHGVLASAAALRLYEENPDGARWELVYPDVDPCPPCGMAAIQMTSKLFLDAYTAEDR